VAASWTRWANHEKCRLHRKPSKQHRQHPATPVAGHRSARFLQQHEKSFRESLAKLSERVQELKAEVEQLHSSDIFSVKIYKQASDIERLAKQLKTWQKVRQGPDGRYPSNV
jgi:hypothetical protein